MLLMHPMEFSRVVNLYGSKYLKININQIKKDFYSIHTFAVVSIQVSNVSQATLKSDSLNS